MPLTILVTSEKKVSSFHLRISKLKNSTFIIPTLFLCRYLSFPSGPQKSSSSSEGDMPVALYRATVRVGHERTVEGAIPRSLDLRALTKDSRC